MTIVSAPQTSHEQVVDNTASMFSRSQSVFTKHMQNKWADGHLFDVPTRDFVSFFSTDYYGTWGFVAFMNH